MQEKHVTLIADSGSTKTAWLLTDGNQKIVSFYTEGINPIHQSEEKIRYIFTEDVKRLLVDVIAKTEGCTIIEEIKFYGAGCRGEAAQKVKSLLLTVFPTSVVNVYSDLMAAAHALSDGNDAIICILGTGANSCLYVNNEIVSNVSPLGYILGDEGSGAVLGKLFINALFKGGLSDGLLADFLESHKLTIDDIIQKVYREPMANRFLASFSPFIHSHLNNPEVEQLVVDNFIDFFKKNINHYQRPDLPVSAVGSVAYYYENQLRKAAAQCGYRIGKILKEPITGLIQF